MSVKDQDSFHRNPEMKPASFTAVRRKAVVSMPPITRVHRHSVILAGSMRRRLHDNGAMARKEGILKPLSGFQIRVCSECYFLCTFNVYLMYFYCTLTVPKFYYTFTVLSMHFYCTFLQFNVLLPNFYHTYLLCFPCTFTVRTLQWDFTALNLLLLYFDRIWLYFQCTFNVLLLHFTVIY